LSIGGISQPVSTRATITPERLNADERPITVGDWRQAVAGYDLLFPRDHASHPEYRLEWWYYTGNLESTDGRKFGYQLTFFRTGVDPKPQNPSKWAVRDLFIAHFAISDIDGKSFRSFERINRSGIGWAGADSGSYHVWNEGWIARMSGADHLLRAFESGYGIELTLEPSKQVVLHGAEGISQKGQNTGNASHYYSITRLRTKGRIQMGRQQFEVSGDSWMDHEFGTTFLETEQVGWDWFSIQLDDGRDLMLFQLRRRDGSIDVHSSGTLVEVDGRVHQIRFGEFSLRPLTTWRSRNSNAEYPSSWIVEVPQFKLRLSVDAQLPDQELRTPESTGVTYWEGSMKVRGRDGEREVRGRGYLEMTGYGDQNMGAIMN
jgi:predicted secreted hydrolase